MYESYTYDSPKIMNDTCMQIVRKDFLGILQSYAYDTKTHFMTSPSDAHANHVLRICMRTLIICKRLTLEVYA